MEGADAGQFAASSAGNGSDPKSGRLQEVVLEPLAGAEQGISRARPVAGWQRGAASLAESSNEASAVAATQAHGVKSALEVEEGWLGARGETGPCRERANALCPANAAP